MALLVSGCGNDDDAGADGLPTIMATTSIWADVVANVACDDQAEVITLIPPGGDPHAFQPSLQDRGRMEGAVMIVANGLDLEEGLGDTLEAVEEAGTPVFHMADHIETIGFAPGMELEHHEEEEGEGEEHHEEEEGEGEEHHEEEEGEGEEHHEEEEGEGEEHHEEEEGEGEEHHEEEEGEGEEHHEEEEGEGEEHHEEEEGEGEEHHEEEEEGEDHGDEEEGHGHSGEDPHVWFDPIKVADALLPLSEALAAQAGLDADALSACVAEYRGELIALDAEIDGILAPLSHEKRLMLTNHDALGYFANRYDFELVGTVIPGGSSIGEASPAALQELIGLIEQTGVPAIFAESTHSSDDAEALARQAGVEVVVLDTGSLGPSGSDSDTYLGFLRTNAQRIAGALG
ncbi:metal ABC transporter substrate-binding protein [Candidatus Poriferisocius sp.]|uniref:metal ABC transporter substrate-binding protein n=1 Tax=Candidatus Poriferisocius sp. TaxID=3101276 RepID=UPI003B014749